MLEIVPLPAFQDNYIWTLRDAERKTPHAAVIDPGEARPVKEITVKGREKPVMTYEVLGLKGEPALVPPPASKSDPAPPPTE